MEHQTKQKSLHHLAEDRNKKGQLTFSTERVPKFW